MWSDFLSSHALTALLAGVSLALLGWPVVRLHRRLKRGQARREREAIQVATQAFEAIKARGRS